MARSIKVDPPLLIEPTSGLYFDAGASVLANEAGRIGVEATQLETEARRLAIEADRCNAQAKRNREEAARLKVQSVALYGQAVRLETEAKAASFGGDIPEAVRARRPYWEEQT